MGCLVVTRGGLGTIWLFPNRAAAWCHPIYQYGDAIMSDEKDMMSQYNRLEWGHLRNLAGLPHMPFSRPTDVREVRREMEYQAPAIWRRLLERAFSPPSDPQQICDLVSQDRRLGSVMAKRKEGTELPEGHTAPAESGNGADPSAKEKTSTIGVRGPKGVPLDTVIQMGSDKEGRKYGPDNNPKKEGSKTHGRFALYSDGMTLQQALDAGIQTGDLVYDRDHGYIQFGTSEAASTAIQETVEQGDLAA